MTATDTSVFTSKYRELIRAFPLRPLRDRADAAEATRVLDRHTHDFYEDEGEEAYALVLSQLLEDYKRRHDASADPFTGADALRKLMDVNNLTQRDVANLLGVGQNAVAMILSGDRPITAEHAKRLGEWFGMNAGAFL